MTTAPSPAENRQQTEVQRRSLGYQPVLDGVRGLAWLAVFAAHAELLPHLAAGQVAMFVFFALSGFLITSLLVTEYRQAGCVSLRNFYARRALRLLPALFLFLAGWLAVVVLFRHSSWLNTVPGGGSGNPESLHVALEGVGAAMGYVTNWFQIFHVFTGYVPLGHLWSLAVEEQFYLLWAPVLAVILARSSRRAWVWAAALAAASFLDVIVVHHSHSTSQWVYVGTDTRSGAFLVGGVLGILWTMHQTSPPWWVRSCRFVIGVCCGALLGACWVFAHPVSRQWYQATWVTVSLAAPVLMVALVDRKRLGRHALLETRLLTYLGRRSYALYLWHYVWLTWMRDLGLLGTLIAFGASLASAELSWRLVESRALSFKARFSAPVVAARAQEAAFC